MSDSITLYQLSQQIERVIKQNFHDAVWIRAEISELRENRGHCYLQLVEKEADGDNIITKMRATIWANIYRMLKPYFESSSGESLRAGLKVLVSVTVEYSAQYGFSLNIRDIDPVFTVGELAARRQEIMRQLEEEGVADMNKTHPFPTLPQRLAIITSETAAGYGDFINQLESNSYGYVFYKKLFPAIMQGVNAEASIIAALERIHRHKEQFDLVLIIRGGGATADLASFDSYNLALHCAQFPLPIITGIGHQRDVSILDMVAHTSVKTPTAAAELLILKMREAEEQILRTGHTITEISATISQREQQRIEFIKMGIRETTQRLLLSNFNLLSQKNYRLRNIKSKLFISEQALLDKIESRIEMHSPRFLSEYGYSITTLNGERINSAKLLKKGDTITTHFEDGSVESEVY